MARLLLLLMASASSLAAAPGTPPLPGINMLSPGLARAPLLNSTTGPTTGPTVSPELAPTVGPISSLAAFIAQNRGNQSAKLAADVNGDEERLITQVAVAATDNYPWMVYIKVTLPDGTFADCGGSIITESFVLTAAQCVVQAATITVLAGTFDSSTATSPAPALPVQARVGSAIIYPAFRRRSLVHDIALVQIFVPFKISGVVAPIKLLKTPKTLDYYNVRVLGWGPAVVSTAIGTALNFEDMSVLPKADCADKMLEMWTVYASSHLCLDTANKDKGFCYGDTGGPVLFKFAGDSTYTLVGVMSDYPTCPSSYPDAFTTVVPYINWIKLYVKKGLL